MVIRKKENIVSEKFEENTTTFILKDNTYLSDTFDKTPNGIVIKNNTGIGATSLELKAKRNSIIVEPLKVTASLKAKKSSDYFYAGSKTEHFSSDFDENKLRAYLNNSSIGFKKIIVVADSLPKVYKLLSKEEKNDFFLMVDESDTFQLDSSFRESMSSCYRIYKKHPKELRCLLTATPIDFNDPELKDEKKTFFKHENEQNRDITISYVNNNIGFCADLIAKYYTANPDKKIMVAFNDVGELYNLAKKVEKNLSLGRGKIAILCSKSKQQKADVYFKELRGEMLPTSINLVTSAYFTGYDLNEPYRLMVLTTENSKLNQHTTDRLKQIAGRCRTPNKLISEDIIHKFNSETSITETEWTLEELEKQARTLLEVLNCMKVHLLSSSSLKNEIEEIQKQFLKSSKLKPFGFDLLSKNDDAKYELNYLAVDAILHIQKEINSTYRTKNQLADKLVKEGHNVVEVESTSSTKVGKESALIKEEALETNVKEIARLIEKLKNGSKLTELYEELSLQCEQDVVKEGLEIFERHKDRFEQNELKIEIQNNVAKQKAKNNLKLLDVTLRIISTSHLKRLIYSTYEVGVFYSDKEKFELFKQTFEKIAPTLISSVKEQFLKQLSNEWFEFKRSKKGYKFHKNKTFAVTCIELVDETPDSVKKKSFRSLDF